MRVLDAPGPIATPPRINRLLKTPAKPSARDTAATVNAIREIMILLVAKRDAFVAVPGNDADAGDDDGSALCRV
jgi:hypothetical protein